MFPNRPTKFYIGQRVCKEGAREGCFLIISKDGISLTIREKSVTASMAQDVKRGMAQFRAVEVSGVLVFLFRFGMGRWYRVCYHRGQYPDFDIPKMGTLSIRVLLVDQQSGWLKVVRDEKLSFPLSSMIVQTLSAQESGLPGTFHYSVQRIQRKHSLQQMVARAGLQGYM